MDRILNAKHWQIFIIIIFGLLISNFTVVNDRLTTTIMNFLGMIIYFGYPLLVGHFLFNYLPKKIDLNHTLFLVNSFIWLTIYFIVMIISDGEGMTFSGLAAIPMLYVFYAFLHFLTFSIRTLKSIELNKKARLSNYIGDFFLMIFLPIGIWFLQPRINKIVKENSEITS